jgi:hypothetical protein
MILPDFRIKSGGKVALAAIEKKPGCKQDVLAYFKGVVV